MKTISILLLLLLSVNAQDKIINGTEITGHQAPWQLSLKSRFGTHYCGAVLIKEDVALTAAHCVSGGSDLTVYGDSTTGELSKLKKISRISNIVIHPEFNPDDFTAHDIAIVFLKSKAQISETLRPIDIINQNNSLNIHENFHLMGDMRIQTTGWGMTTPPNILQEPAEQLSLVEVKSIATSNGSILIDEILSYLEIKYDVGEYTLERINTSGARTILTEGIENIGGTCSGDSGGPVVAFINEEPFLIGVSSYTAGGEERCLGFSIHTNVQDYSAWIESEIL